MKATRIFTLLLAAVIIIVALVVRSGSDDPTSTPTTTVTETTPDTPVPPGSLVIPFAYSPEKQRILEPLIAEFNASGAKVGNEGVFIEGKIVASGGATDAIAAQTLQTVIWSPSSSLWGRIVNFKTDSEWVAAENPSLVRTPLVIAMWEPLARALGWPDKQLGWSDILREAQSDQGWAAHGHPEWGRFKLGHTNPDFSTSGLSAVVAEYLTATGKPEGLTLEDVAAKETRQKVRAIERSIVHYGDTTLFFADRLAEAGPSYASAVALEEVTLLDFNVKRTAGQTRLAAIYPKEGTFFSDNPLIVLNAPWVTEPQKAGAKQFVDFLAGKVTPELAGQFSFRPADTSKKPSGPITAANLVDPAQPTSTLGLPEPRVLDAIRTAWRADRKPATVQIVLDVSGSMNDEGKLEAAKEGIGRFLALMQPQDKVGLTTFSETTTEITPPELIKTARASLITRVEGLIAGGGTAVYDATFKAVEARQKEANKDRISAVVVLTDGADNRSATSLESLLAALRAQTEDEDTSVRVFTIAYGTGAEKQILEQIAGATRGKAYVGDPATIEKVYTQIASFF